MPSQISIFPPCEPSDRPADPGTVLFFGSAWSREPFRGIPARVRRLTGCEVTVLVTPLLSPMGGTPRLLQAQAL